MKRLRIFFDLGTLDDWHRREWEDRFAAADPTNALAVTDRATADCIVSTSTPWHFSNGGRSFGHVAADRDRPPRFVWDQSDLPGGHERGFYCSLPRLLFDPRRHRTCHYAISFNECIQAGDLSEAHYLAGFVGGVTSGLRSRLLRHLKSWSPADFLFEEQSGPWTQMFDRSGLAVKKNYASALRRCRFFLCPRGNGVGSVRLFETMQSARVPVILSDGYVLPPDINWDACAVRIAEKDLRHIPDILRARHADWPRLAANARRIWEERFSEKVFLTTLAGGIRSLHSAPAYPSAAHAWQRGLFVSLLKLRRGAGHARSSARRLLNRPAPTQA
jgi:hypothetical protein